jgi:hypothetical protein
MESMESTPIPTPFGIPHIPTPTIHGVSMDSWSSMDSWISMDSPWKSMDIAAFGHKYFRKRVVEGI